MTTTPDTLRTEMEVEWNEVCARLRELLANASDSDLRSPSRGTRWTNEELLWHMVFGYLVVRALLGVVRFFDALPPGASEAYAAALNRGTKPFDAVNYWGSRAGAIVFNRRRMAAQLERVIASLQRRLDDADARTLAKGMHFPTLWDPFFRDYMTLEDLYRYPTQHFNFHQEQLALSANGTPRPAREGRARRPARTLRR
ncbi:MAG: DinB family protein [Lapillicoccus sp.]